MSYRPTRYIRTALESGASVEVVTDGAGYGLKLTSAEGSETRCRLSAEAVAAISSGFNALALGKGEPIKYEWRVVRELHKLEQEAPTTPERAKALEDAARVAEAEAQRLRAMLPTAREMRNQISMEYSTGGRIDVAIDIARSIRALSASPPEVEDDGGNHGKDVFR